MKTLKVALAALVLTGCGAKSHTLAVEGEPDAVAHFVSAEEARAGEVKVSYKPGGRRAEFSVPDEQVQTAMRLRAATARLAATETSVVWSFSTGS